MEFTQLNLPDGSTIISGYNRGNYQSIDYASIIEFLRNDEDASSTTSVKIYINNKLSIHVHSSFSKGCFQKAISFGHLFKGSKNIFIKGVPIMRGEDLELIFTGSVDDKNIQKTSALLKNFKTLSNDNIKINSQETESARILFEDGSDVPKLEIDPICKDIFQAIKKDLEVSIENSDNRGWKYNLCAGASITGGVICTGFTGAAFSCGMGAALVEVWCNEKWGTPIGT